MCPGRRRYGLMSSLQRKILQLYSDRAILNCSHIVRVRRHRLFIAFQHRTAATRSTTLRCFFSDASSECANEILLQLLDVLIYIILHRWLHSAHPLFLLGGQLIADRMLQVDRCDVRPPHPHISPRLRRRVPIVRPHTRKRT
jgi:hypothetical protein